jgi:quercetin dioxygenase-like cupin family protein
MTANGPDDRPHERAALFAAGALPPDEAGPSEAELLAEAGEFGPAVAGLAGAIPPVEPPPEVKARLLARLGPPDDPGAAAGPAGVSFRFAAAGGFAPSPFPGLWVRILHIDRPRRQFTAVLRLDPGASYPAHPHDGPEECLVLEGELLVGGVRMRAGDYQRAEPGSEHAEQRTATGALLFVTAPLSLLSPPGGGPGPRGAVVFDEPRG